MKKLIDEQICDLYKKRGPAGPQHVHWSFKQLSEYFGVDVNYVSEVLGNANLIRRSKVVPIGTLVACRRFGGHPRSNGRA